MLDSTSTPSIYRPRSPRASPLWQIVHHSWNDFLADYESKYRKIHGPLRPFSIDAVNDSVSSLHSHRISNTKSGNIPLN